MLHFAAVTKEETFISPLFTRTGVQNTHHSGEYFRVYAVNNQRCFTQKATKANSQCSTVSSAGAYFPVENLQTRMVDLVSFSFVLLTGHPPPV